MSGDEQYAVMRLTSDAFEEGGRILEQYGSRAANVNPPLSVHDVPAGTESLVLDCGETKVELEMTTEAHALDEARLTGTYAP